jgi:hypothetical protein
MKSGGAIMFLPPKIPNLILPEHLKFNTQRQKAFEFVQDLTKQVLALSTGILALTITFADKIKRGGWDELLSVAWGLYIVAIIFGVFVLYALAGTLEQTTTNVPVSTRGSNVILHARIQFGAFVLATILIATQAVFTARKAEVQTETDKLVIERNQTTQLLAIVQKLGTSEQSIKDLQIGTVAALQELGKETAAQLNSVTQELKAGIELIKSGYLEKLPPTINTIDFTELLVVTGEGIRLREGPSTGSKVIDKLRGGTVVKSIKKLQDWAFVEVMYSGLDDTLQGWIFTRYTSPIRESK